MLFYGFGLFFTTIVIAPFQSSSEHPLSHTPKKAASKSTAGRFEWVANFLQKAGIHRLRWLVRH